MFRFIGKTLSYQSNVKVLGKSPFNSEYLLDPLEDICDALINTTLGKSHSEYLLKNSIIPIIASPEP